MFPWILSASLGTFRTLSKPNMAAEPAAKKRSSAAVAKDVQATSDTLALTKAIVTIQKNQVSFAKSVDDAKHLIEEYLQDLELRASEKRDEMKKLDAMYEEERRSKKIRIDQDLQAYGYAEALKVLAERKEVAISQDELTRLKNELETMKRDKAKEVAELVRVEREKHESALKTFQTTNDLKHAAEIATQTASNKQLQGHIAVLEKQIQSLQDDVNKQRQLTKDVAESARPQYMTAPGNPQR